MENWVKINHLYNEMQDVRTIEKKQIIIMAKNTKIGKAA